MDVAIPFHQRSKIGRREYVRKKVSKGILRKSAYVVPTLLTLAAKPSLASSGYGRCDSQYDREKGGGEWEDHGNSRHEHESKKPKKKGKKH